MILNFPFSLQDKSDTHFRIKHTVQLVISHFCSTTHKKYFKIVAQVGGGGGDENTFLVSVQIAVISAHSDRQFGDKFSTQIKAS